MNEPQNAPPEKKTSALPEVPWAVFAGVGVILFVGVCVAPSITRIIGPCLALILATSYLPLLAFTAFCDRNETAPGRHVLFGAITVGAFLIFPKFIPMCRLSPYEEAFLILELESPLLFRLTRTAIVRPRKIPARIAQTILGAGLGWSVFALVSFALG